MKSEIELYKKNLIYKNKEMNYNNYNQNQNNNNMC